MNSAYGHSMIAATMENLCQNDAVLRPYLLICQTHWNSKSVWVIVKKKKEEISVLRGRYGRDIDDCVAFSHFVAISVRLPRLEKNQTAFRQTDSLNISKIAPSGFCIMPHLRPGIQ